MGLSDQRARAVDACRRTEEDADHAAADLYASATLWSLAQTGILVPATVASALATVVAIDGKGGLAAALALVAGILTGIALLLEPADKRRRAQEAGTRYTAVRNQARNAAEVALADERLTSTQITRVVDDLEDTRARVASTSPMPGWAGLAHRLGGRNIRAGGTTNRVDVGTARDRSAG